jgi:anaerobic sulfite reductase subunit B
MATAPVADPRREALTPLPFVVTGREQETEDTWTIALEAVAHDGPSVRPGQFLMVYAFGIGEVPISVSRLPDDGLPLALTVRSVGAVTASICSASPGDVLGVRGPFGNEWPVDEGLGGDVVVVAGGIGLAPLRPVVLATVRRRDEFGSVALLYGARTPPDLLYRRDLDAWRETIDVDVTVDAAAGGWIGRVGVVPKLVAAASFRADRATAFVCGPEIMMRFTVDALLERGLSPDRIHVSLERHMDCGVGLCGHCQLGPTLICRDGPVYPYSAIAPLLEVRQL